MTTKNGNGPQTAIASAFQHRGRHYEQRFVNCGKANCTKCNPVGGTSRPTHGPYWYLCAQRGKRWRRVYLGKELDTEKYVDGDGHIDWKAIANRRAKGTPGEGMSSTAPGQLDMVDAAANPTPATEATP